MNFLEKSVLLKNELDILRPIDKEQEDRILQKFRLDWNYHSNHIEGNSLTYGETKALLLFGITASGKPIKDHLEVEGHNEAINYIMDIIKDDEQLTESFIRGLHKLLLKKRYQVDAITPDGAHTKRWIEVGQYKTTNNHVLTKTGEKFYFASVEETPAKMMDLLDWYKEKKEHKETNGILLAAEFHYKFIRIHPFDDGNGRMARILMNFILMQYGYPPVIIKTEDKENYFITLQQADAGTIEPFIEYIGTNLNHSLEIMIAGAIGENIDEPEDIDKEIALLEQRVNAVGKKITVIKSNKALLNIYENSLKKLFNKFEETCKKFDRFYFESKISYWKYSSIDGMSRPLSLSKIHEELDETLIGISLLYKYNDFNNVNIQPFSFNIRLILEFEKTKIQIRVFSEVNDIVKYYDEQLTDEEINHLMKIITKVHTEFINQKLNEAKAKN